MKISIFWDIMACRQLKVDQRFGGTYRRHLKGRISRAICSSETSVDFQRTTWRYVPEDSALHVVYYRIVYQFRPRHSFSYICKSFLKFMKTVCVVFVQRIFTANQGNSNRVMLVENDRLHLFFRRRYRSIIPFRNEPCLSWFHCKSCGVKSGDVSGQISFKLSFHRK
jgi:hypothetical protein